ncbi:hypothetical protein QL285_049393 [Trifolium repens]|nr:hypothetical protein QL285_049393 [Trifolium repens]
MAVCDWNMCFTFVLAGWEGTAHDARVFDQALTNKDLNFPHPPPGKYYLVDSGYPTLVGYIGPYRCERYHLPEFRRSSGFENHNEVFNYYHSSLRCTIERTFGVWKNRFAILRRMPKFKYETQVQIVVATMAIHNFIRRTAEVDSDFNLYEDENTIIHHDENHRSNNLDPSQIFNVASSSEMDHARDLIRGENDGGWFDANISSVLGNGKELGFWKEKWIGTATLKFLYPDLYNKSSLQNGTVSMMGSMVHNAWEWSFDWTEPLSDAEAASEIELLNLLFPFQPYPDVEDRHRWIPSSAGIFSVKCAYIELVNRAVLVNLDDTMVHSLGLMWQNNVPSKISIFGWRLLIERLPTREALFNKDPYLDGAELHQLHLCSAPFLAIWRIDQE